MKPFIAEKVNLVISEATGDRTLPCFYSDIEKAARRVAKELGSLGRMQFIEEAPSPEDGVEGIAAETAMYFRGNETATAEDFVIELIARLICFYTEVELLSRFDYTTAHDTEDPRTRLKDTLYQKPA